MNSCNFQNIRKVHQYVTCVSNGDGIGLNFYLNKGCIKVYLERKSITAEMQLLIQKCWKTKGVIGAMKLFPNRTLRLGQLLHCFIRCRVFIPFEANCSMKFDPICIRAATRQGPVVAMRQSRTHIKKKARSWRAKWFLRAMETKATPVSRIGMTHKITGRILARNVAFITVSRTWQKIAYNLTFQ